MLEITKPFVRSLKISSVKTAIVVLKSKPIGGSTMAMEAGMIGAA
jgi:hypothetical protein